MARVWTRGLRIAVDGPAAQSAPELLITAEASLIVPADKDLRVDTLVDQEAEVQQGQPLMTYRHYPGLALTAPMPGRVAVLDVDTAKRLRSIKIFHDPSLGRHDFGPTDIQDAGEIRDRLKGTGIWRMIRSRPFGKFPEPEEHPSAIFVMAMDTRPGAVDPRRVIDGQDAAFDAGLRALARIAEEHVYLCQDARGPSLPVPDDEKIRIQTASPVHPWGLAGLHVHRACPAAIDKPVWDIAAEDVIAFGTVLETGHLPETRLVSVTGSGMREARLLRCQPWADMRGLCQGHVRPGQNAILSGSILDGRPGRWFRDGDRQVTVRAQSRHDDRRHWFLSALRGASRPLPLIPSAAVDHALGGEIPAMALLRAISSGDTDTAIRLGALSLLPEDLALADYVTGADPSLSDMFASLLDRIETEETG